MDQAAAGDLFFRLAAVLAVAAGVGVVGILLRQPLIVAFIAVGVLAGPTWLGVVNGTDDVWPVLASTGIAVLLFVVGLRLDLDVIRRVGPVALFTGLGQVAFTAGIGFGLSLLLGMGPTEALYVAVALTFSSTIIIVKLLSDKREIDSLHGRIAVGFLIVQDIVVVLVMVGLSAFGAGAEDSNALQEAALVVLKGVGLLAAVAVATRFLVPPAFAVMARSQELLVVGAIAWALALAVLGEELGFSREVGAFLAGVSLASTPFRDSISTRLVSLRDFLLLFFFVTLGADLDLSLVGSNIPQAVVLSLFVLVGNPLIVLIIMGFMGYRRRTAFLAGLTVAQISEFSLILASLGLSLGHIEDDTVGLITLVGLITIGLSTYMIMYSHRIYAWLAPLLRPFERSVPYREQGEDDAEAEPVDVVIFGLGRFGHNLADALAAWGVPVLGVDFDPRVVENWRREGRRAHYGDAEDREFPAALPLHEPTWVVSTLPGVEVNLELMQALRERGYGGHIALTAHSYRDRERLAAGGAEVVLLPFVDAAERAAEMLAEETAEEAAGSAASSLA